MFIKNRVTGLNKNQLTTSESKKVVGSYIPRVEASTQGGGISGSTGIPTSVTSNWASEYQYMMTGILPADPLLTDYASLRPFYRDMYLLDATAGSAVDIHASFPFSEVNLRGMTEAELRPFEEACESLNAIRMMPELSTSYLVDGFFCGTLVFNPAEKMFVDTLIHDAMQCTVKHTPFFNYGAEIEVRVSQSLQRFLGSDSPYVQRYLKTLPKVFIDLLYQGKFELNPLTTLYVPRKSLSDRANTSYLHRLLPFYLIEKTLFRGTLTEAHKRQRAMTHITAGDDEWIPDQSELMQLTQLAQQAEMDPLGGWMTTRNAVQMTDIRPAGDFWKWMDVLDQLTPYKLRALQISESFLTGDASYAAAESAYATFIEQQASFRDGLTDAVFYKRIFPLVALVNGLYKDPALAKKNMEVNQYLTDVRTRSNLKIPELVWKKKLEADREEGVFESLTQLDERGIPIPLKSWIAAAGLDYQTLVTDLKEDPEIRSILKEHISDVEDSGGEEDLYARQGFPFFAGPGGAPTISMNSGARKRRALLGRDFKDTGLISVPNRSGSGRKHVFDQKRVRAQQNDFLMKAMRELRDKHKLKAAVERAKRSK